jgi:hypothetical protein
LGVGSAAGLVTGAEMTALEQTEHPIGTPTVSVPQQPDPPKFAE